MDVWKSNTLTEYMELVSVVILSAPDAFDRKPFLREDQQLTLEKASAELLRGMPLVAKGVQDDALVVELRGLLERSLAAYRNGDKRTGVLLLQEFDERIMRRMAERRSRK